jgi:NodT family efflux transporter outer membrane factor (OMF) lipoprotein
MKKRTQKALSLLLTAAILSSATFIPVLAKAPLKAQISETKIQKVNLEWWSDYNDEYLEGYIVKALNDNQDLQIATLRAEEAGHYVKLQFANELPNASVGFSPLLYKMPGTKDNEHTFSFPMMVNYEADIFLKNRDKTKSAKKNQEASVYQEKATYIAIASQIGSTYYNIVKLDKLISVQEELIKDRERISELMKLRNQQGITSTADFVRAQKAHVMAVADLTDLKKARNVLLSALAVMIGESPNNAEELKRISYEELVLGKIVPDSIPSNVIVQRPDYLAAEKMLEKAGIDVRVAKKEFLPTIDLIGLLSFSTGSMSSSMNWANALAALGGQAMLPLFTGGKKVTNLKLSKNQYEQTLQKYFKTNLTAIQEVNDALSSLKLDSEKYEKNLESYGMQEKDFNYMRIRYENGIISNLDLLQQREALLAMNKMVISSKIDCYVSEIGLYKAVGGKQVSKSI